MLEIAVLCILAIILRVVFFTVILIIPVGNLSFIQSRLGLFPSAEKFNILLFRGFLLLSCLNLFSLVCYRYAVTTTLSFNLALALGLWLRRILIMGTKLLFLSSLLPRNSPWYLVPFLCLVELIRLVVRPVTLCFRLLANIRAGHILLSLICKIAYFLWLLGAIFGALELIVSLVQAFVFLILVRVYLDEAARH